MPTSSFRPRFRSGAGFTLVELLVVLAIVAILAAASLPSVNGVMRSYQLETTAQGVVNQLTLARQTARTEGYAVQVRLYELPDSNQSATSSPTVYRAMQAFLESAPSASGTVTITPVTKPFIFQTGVVFLNDPSKTSTILGLTGTTASSSSDPVLPNYQSNYAYKIFRFLPSGQTDLPANLTSSTYCLSVVQETAPLTSSGLPANFQTIQIDGINGNIRSFRP
jgi:uncharacterized protein (TIGR02596 family)